MGSDIQVEIDKTESCGTFTNYDLISGVVKLTTTNSISLACIQVKLEGISTTQLTIPKRRPGKDKKDKLVQDVHKVLYDSLIVFPPENIRLVSTTKEFTLTPGNYTYPFQFKIPLNNACAKMSGLTNKILINKKSFDIMLNNGNFNSTVIKNAANNYFQAYANPANHQKSQQMQQQSIQQQNYHVQTQLPPSLGHSGDPASVRYFVKVTAKRSSFLKANLRAFDPFTFLPLDLDVHNQPLVEGRLYEEYREVFYRKDMVFKDRLPEIIGVKADAKKALPKTPTIAPQKKSFMLSFFGTSSSGTLRPPTMLRTSKGVEVNTMSVPFSFEVRFRYPAFLIPLRPPSFKLFFVTDVNPSKFSLAQHEKPDESNGLGVIYLQRLMIELRSTTLTSVLESDGAINEIHQARSENSYVLCNNTYQNLQFDLKNTRRLKSSSASSSGFVSASAHELEIPRKYFENWELPYNLAPSFQTCNISRKYSLTIVAGISSEAINDFNNKAEVDRKIKYVDLHCPEVKVLSGLKLTSTLHSNASGTSIGRQTDRKNPLGPDRKPPLPDKPSANSIHSESGHSSVSVEDTSRLPTYDDVVRESSFQDDSEHYRARRRYGG